MSFVIEEECGTCCERWHQHDGYYAGDFSHRPVRPVDGSSSEPLMGAAA